MGVSMFERTADHGWHTSAPMAWQQTLYLKFAVLLVPCAGAVMWAVEAMMEGWVHWVSWNMDMHEREACFFMRAGLQLLASPWPSMRGGHG